MDPMVRVAMSMYVGESCKFCDREFTSVEDIVEKEAVYAGYHDKGRLACKACWDRETK